MRFFPGHRVSRGFGIPPAGGDRHWAITAARRLVVTGARRSFHRHQVSASRPGRRSVAACEERAAATGRRPEGGKGQDARKTGEPWMANADRGTWQYSVAGRCRRL